MKKYLIFITYVFIVFLKFFKKKKLKLIQELIVQKI